MTKIIPATIAPLMRLPYLPLAEVKALPPVAAVYFVIERGGVVLYVGRTRNLAQRWRNHHRAAQLDAGKTWVAWFPVGAMSEAQLARLERICIRRFAPRLNDTPMERKAVTDTRPFAEQFDRQTARLNAQVAACNKVQQHIAATEQGIARDMESAIRWLRVYHQNLVTVAHQRDQQRAQTHAALLRLRQQCDQFMPAIRGAV